ncbi:MAG: hypothetical protein Q7S28_00585 [bacterium]|nr:hypothetical protein [bacterium]
MGIESFKNNIEEVPQEKNPAESSPEVSKEELEAAKGWRWKKIEKIGGIAWLSMMTTFGGYIGERVAEKKLEYKTYSESVSPQEQARYEAYKKEIVKHLGEKGLQGIEAAEHRRFEQLEHPNAEKDVAPLAIRGFETLGLHPETLELLWSDKNGVYPKQWITGELRGIEYTDEHKQMGSEYGVAMAEEESAATSTFDRIEFHNARKEVDEYTPDEKDKKAGAAILLDQVFGHEIGHHNDWELDAHLTRADRAELLSRVLERMQSNDHFKPYYDEINNIPSYHEKIRNEDKQKKVYLQAREYWADLCSDYFFTPDTLEKEHPADYALVDEYVKKSDPHFSPEKAMLARVGVYKQIAGEGK